MDDSLLLPAAVIGVMVLVFGAALGVAQLSGSLPFHSPAPPNLAPFESATPYAVGDILQSEDISYTVIVTGYDANQEYYSFQQVSVNSSTGDVHIMEGTRTMKSKEFETKYPHKIFPNS